MVFSGLRTRSTRRDLMVFMSRPLLFLQRTTDSMKMAAYVGNKKIHQSLDLFTQFHRMIFAYSKVVHVLREDDFRFFYPITLL